MTAFAIAGIQMPVSASEENASAMGRRLDLLVSRYPWVQMAVFGELTAVGPLPRFAQALSRRPAAETRRHRRTAS